MSSFQTGLLILFVMFGGALLGMLLSRFLPEHHLSSEARAVISVSMATVGTLAALVLGLLISTASSSYATKNQEMEQLSNNLIRIDRILRRLGPAARKSRDVLRQYAAMKMQDLFGAREAGSHRDNPRTIIILEELEDDVSSLKPANSTQQWLQSQALEIAGGLETTPWTLSQDSSTLIPLPLLGAMVIWLTIIFMSFGLFARHRHRRRYPLDG